MIPKVANDIMDADRRRRAAIARRLHDGVAQVLTSVGVELDLLRLDFEHVEGMKQRIISIQETLQNAFNGVRMLTQSMTPERLNSDGLIAALASLEGVTVQVLDKPDLTPVETAAFYLIAEVLTSAASAGGQVSMTISSNSLRISGCEPSPLAEIIAAKAAIKLTSLDDIIEVAI